MKKDGQRSVFLKKKQGAKPKRAKKAPGRPPLAGRPTYLRLDDETLRRVEARQKALQAQNKVSNVGQGDVLRALVRDGLDLAEEKHALSIAERTLSAAARKAEAVLNQAESSLEECTPAFRQRIADAALSLRGAIHGASSVVIAIRGGYEK